MANSPGASSFDSGFPECICECEPADRGAIRSRNWNGESLVKVKDLLPAPRSATKPPKPLVSESLCDVPEVQFQEQFEKEPCFSEAKETMAKLLRRINELNGKKTDGFVEGLIQERPDLAGLPFAMGDACRTRSQDHQWFRDEVAVIQERLRLAKAHQLPEHRADAFWEVHEGGLQAKAPSSKQDLERFMSARYAALTQILAPDTPAMRLGLVRNLASASNAAATRSLVVLAVFAPEREVRLAALDALQSRSTENCNDVLLKGLRYPWPPVVRQTTEAIAALKRKDLIPQLVAMLDEPDPRSPSVREVKGKKTIVARELVRINHHRSCVLCHAPADRDTPNAVLTVQSPLPDDAPLEPGQYYGHDLLVRIDVTYLRQDFSVLFPAQLARFKGKMERFDFLVQERTLSELEAEEYRRVLEGKNDAKLAPHRIAALEALRKLTGRNAAPNSKAWQKTVTRPL